MREFCSKIEISYNGTVNTYLVIAVFLNTFSTSLSYYDIHLFNKVAYKLIFSRRYLLRRYSVVYCDKRITFRKISPKEYCTVIVRGVYREGSAFVSVLVYILDHIRSHTKTDTKYEETH